MRGLSITSLLLLIIAPLLAQKGMVGLLNLEGRVIEIREEQNILVEGARVVIPERGEQTTGRGGLFFFEIPIREREWLDKQLFIQVTFPGYELIEPYDGQVFLDTPRVEVDLYVADREMAGKLRQEMKELKERIKDLQSQEKISLRRIDQLRKTMIDTILHFERREISYERSIEQMGQQIERTANENEALRDSLRSANVRLEQMKESNKALRKQLFEALEEKYQRQQAAYEDITGGLSDYLLRLKDVCDLFPKVREYFSAPAYIDTYNTTITDYNEAYQRIIEKRDAWQEIIQHYWEAPQPGQSLDQVLDQLIQDVHKQYVLSPLRAIESHIRKRSVGAARKTGRTAFEKLHPRIGQLEQEIDAVIDALRETI